MNNFIFIITLLSSTLLFGCRNTPMRDNADAIQTIEVTLNNNDTKELRHPTKERSEDVIFYNMFSPLDINKILDKKTSYFNSSYINSLSNIVKYTSSQKAALNIGIYGANLSYLLIFDQNQQALSYFNAIKHLTNKLGIPDNLVDITAKSAEQNSNKIDSLSLITRNSFFTVDTFLKENNQENYALLILFGGWIESFYIALHMYNEPNSKLASKIITQKYSLISLIEMAHNNTNNLMISEYTLLMERMKDAFKTVESQFEYNCIDIDTINKQIIIIDTCNMNIQPEYFSELRSITSQIRNYITE